MAIYNGTAPVICISAVSDCPNCHDQLYYLNGRYKCYSCNHIVLKIVPKRVNALVFFKRRTNSKRG